MFHNFTLKGDVVGGGGGKTSVRIFPMKEKSQGDEMLHVPWLGHDLQNAALPTSLGPKID